MIVEEIVLFRGALAAILSTEEDMTVVAKLDRADGIAAWLVASRPDVIVLGVDRADGPTVDAAARSGRAVLMISNHPTAEALQRALAGRILGFLGPEVTPAAVADAIRAVAAGRRAIGRDLVTAFLRHSENPLTEREMEILRLAAGGTRTGEIALLLRLAPGTVRNYLSTIMRKTGASSRAEAIRRAEEAGWL